MLKIRDLIRVSIFVSLIIVAGLIKIPLYPVPISLSFMVINTICLISDFKICFFSVLLYIIVGLIGIPVFSQGGGIGYVLNLTFGYLIGFLIITLLCSKLKKKCFLNDKPFLKNLILSFINIFVIYLTGAVYAFLLSYFYIKEPIKLDYLITFYVLIFIPWDIISSFFSSCLSVRLKRFVK